MRAVGATLALTLALSLGAHAQDSRADYLRMFDSNGDGRVGEAEYLAYMSRGFQSMDSNGDPITLQVYQDNLRRQFHRLDRNRDGYLNAKELTAPPR
jgi:Ca2+-binding EF-hand superfamily protein